MTVPLVPDVLVDLVHDGDHAETLAEPGDLRELLAREDPSGGVAGRIQDHQSRLVRDGASQPRDVQGIVGFPQRHESRLDPREHTGRQVVLVPGLEHDDLVAGLGQAEDGVHEGLRDAARDRDLVVGVHAHVVEAGAFARDGLTERGRAPGKGVLMVRRVRENSRKGLEQLGRGIEIRQPLREIDAPDLRPDPGHFADDRLPEGARAAREGETLLHSF